jgi:anaerobic ribonucleoside-triphosphate reductase activating protein
MASLIKVGSFLAESLVNGPGLRSVIWVQGCPRRCEGCWNPEYQPLEGGKTMEAAEAVRMLAGEGKVEGVTFLGGEPFYQAGALVEAAFELKKLGLGIMTYSGWTYAELEAMGSPAKDLLALCDLLVDGPFIKEEAADLLWRGSRNQKLRFLTDRYREWEAKADLPYRHFEVLLGEGKATLTGDPDAATLEAFRNMSAGNRGEE